MEEEDSKKFINENGLFKPVIEDTSEQQEDEKKNEICSMMMQMSEESIQQIYQSLNWKTYSFDEYEKGLIRQVPLQSPLKGEIKLVNMINCNDLPDTLPEIVLPNNFDDILEVC